ncbi:flagellar hook-length control protein FliK [Ruminococcaceae bacterium OttesenSCG-928-L11]|nr:flagellar hook-length control protein FliK [Ruminococcaceae bacterium OttesenSCG-928-L11]
MEVMQIMQSISNQLELLTNVKKAELLQTVTEGTDFQSLLKDKVNDKLTKQPQPADQQPTDVAAGQTEQVPTTGGKQVESTEEAEPEETGKAKTEAKDGATPYLAAMAMMADLTVVDTPVQEAVPVEASQPSTDTTVSGIETAAVETTTIVDTGEPLLTGLPTRPEITGRDDSETTVQTTQTVQTGQTAQTVVTDAADTVIPAQTAQTPAQPADSAPVPQEAAPSTDGIIVNVETVEQPASEAAAPTQPTDTTGTQPADTAISDAPEQVRTEPANEPQATEPPVTANTADSTETTEVQAPTAEGEAVQATDEPEMTKPQPPATDNAETEDDPFAERVSQAAKELQEARATGRTQPQTHTIRNERTATSYMRETGALRTSQTTPATKRGESRQDAAAESQAVTAEATVETVQQQSQTQQTAAPRRPEIPQQAEQIRTEVLENLERDQMEFRMQLAPRELGKIDIRMALDGGKLIVEILSSAKTSELLSRQAEGLAATLKSHNPDLTSVQVVTESAGTGAATLDAAFQNMNGSGSWQGDEGGNASHTRGNGGFGQEEPVEEESVQIVGDESRIMDYAV